jgi:hypothetical protein
MPSLLTTEDLLHADLCRTTWLQLQNSPKGRTFSTHERVLQGRQAGCVKRRVKASGSARPDAGSMT